MNAPRLSPLRLPARPTTAAAGPPASSDSDGKYELCDDDRDWVTRIADSLGPLTDRQRDILARRLHCR